MAFKEIKGDYALFVDEDYNISVWSIKIFPVLLFSYNAKAEVERGNGNLVVNEGEHSAALANIEKGEDGLESLFDEAPAASKEVKPVEVVPDQTMIDQMVQMGYGLSIIKKALIAVKNESVPTAIDMIEQITT